MQVNGAMWAVFPGSPKRISRLARNTAAKLSLAWHVGSK